VEVVPGPSAVVSALALSGLSTGRFVFEGFLPRRGSARTERVAELASERRTLVLYEAPHRLRQLLDDLATGLGRDRPVAIARELTKLHEEVWRGSLADAITFHGEVEPRGEYVVVVGGAPEPDEADDDAIRDALARSRADGLSTRDAVAEVASALGVPKRRVYGLATRD
jgi:16S rRNA (cytidine1402-2'-O)-methyltransferase